MSGIYNGLQVKIHKTNSTFFVSSIAHSLNFMETSSVESRIEASQFFNVAGESLYLLYSVNNERN